MTMYKSSIDVAVDPPFSGIYCDLTRTDSTGGPLLSL